MKNLLLISVVFVCLGLALPLLAVVVEEDNDYVIIKTAGYEVRWKKAARMGYMKAFLPGSQDSLIGEADRAFYHSSSYAGGWKDWQELVNWEIAEEIPGKTVINYETKDTGTKEYSSMVTYYDSVPYIKHELTITNTGDATEAFASGHEPMFEPNMDMDGMANFDQPFPHACWWVHGGFVAIYGPEAESADLSARDERDPGRMALNHNNLGVLIANGASASVTYYVAFGPGGSDEADALAASVQEEPLTTAVSPEGNVTTTWGYIRAR